MNELTRAANNMSNAPWLIPVLLGAVTLTGAGNYTAISNGNEQLALLNLSVSETNRLSEMRGSVSSEIKALQHEVQLLRKAMVQKVDIETQRKDFTLLKDVLQAMRLDLESRAHKSTLKDLTDANRALVTEALKKLDGAVSQDQFVVLVGRVDAISRRIDESNK